MHLPARRLPGELVFALVALLFGVTVLWQAYRIAGLASWSSPGAVPMLAGLVMTGAALRIVFDTRRRPPPEVVPGQTPARAFAHALLPRALVGFTVLIALYMVALEPLGFVPSSFLFLVAGMRVLGSRRFGFDVVVSAASLVVIYVIFKTAFSVVLPEGVLRGWLP